MSFRMRGQRSNDERQNLINFLKITNNNFIYSSMYFDSLEFFEKSILFYGVSSNITPSQKYYLNIYNK